MSKKAIRNLLIGAALSIIVGGLTLVIGTAIGPRVTCVETENGRQLQMFYVGLPLPIAWEVVGLSRNGTPEITSSKSIGITLGYSEHWVNDPYQNTQIFWFQDSPGWREHTRTFVECR